jgi:hypothetical protein
MKQLFPTVQKDDFFSPDNRLAPVDPAPFRNLAARSLIHTKESLSPKPFQEMRSG